MALGAKSGGVQHIVVLQGMRLALIGIAVGVAPAFGLRHLVTRFLFGVQSLGFLGIHSDANFIGYCCARRCMAPRPAPEPDRSDLSTEI